MKATPNLPLLTAQIGQFANGVPFVAVYGLPNFTQLTHQGTSKYEPVNGNETLMDFNSIKEHITYFDINK